MSQVHVITGSERRRRWSEDEKRALLAEAFAPDAVVLEVARRADISPSLLYRWRREMGAPSNGFAEVMLARPTRPAVPEPAFIEIEFGPGARLRLPVTTPAALAAAVVAAMARR
jgi:transposase